MLAGQPTIYGSKPLALMLPNKGSASKQTLSSKDSTNQKILAKPVCMIYFCPLCINNCQLCPYFSKHD